MGDWENFEQVDIVYYCAMPGHSGIRTFIHGMPKVLAHGPGVPEAHLNLRCPLCRRKVQGAVIAVTNEGGVPLVAWVRCTNCHRGLVVNDGQLAPTGLAGEDVDGLPVETEQAYKEARLNVASGAFTSCELMCRKILMHVAVDKGAETNKSFAYYIDHLKGRGISRLR